MNWNKIKCRLGFHEWLSQRAYCGSSETGYDTVGEVRQCWNCGKRTKWGSARFPKNWNKHRKVKENEI